ncbi:MAG: large conductance mechanosensitive channel protein MscL [Lachnospiraceae bacterium]|nr:large conductance mechanosensitive channel protein MscL [Lachnospiraceae bacterium]
MLKEFKKFIARGNVLDMAVGIIVGSAFTAIVNSLVNDIFTPLMGLILGGINFSALSVKVGEATIAYGSFIQAVINFLLIAFSVFMLIRVINKIPRKKEEEAAPTTKKCPYCKSEIAIDAVKCPHCTSDIEE